MSQEPSAESRAGRQRELRRAWLRGAAIAAAAMLIGGLLSGGFVAARRIVNLRALRSESRHRPCPPGARERDAGSHSRTPPVQGAVGTAHIKASARAGQPRHPRERHPSRAQHQRQAPCESARADGRRRLFIKNLNLFAQPFARGVLDAFSRATLRPAIGTTGPGGPADPAALIPGPADLPPDVRVSDEPIGVPPDAGRLP